MPFVEYLKAIAGSRSRLLKNYLIVFVAGTVMVGLRSMLETGESLAFLLWNFLLSLLPLFFSSLMLQMHQAGGKKGKMALAGIVWLLFLPNAPYMMTDYIHLRYSVRAYFIFDLLVVTWFVVGAFIAGVISLNDVSGLLAKRYNRLLVSGIVLLICLLCGFGIYLGRDLRFNSWDLLVNPGRLFSDVMERLKDPYADLYTRVAAAAIGLLMYVTHQAWALLRR